MNHVKPLVSVIMPVFNGAAFIETAIRSVLEQSYSNIELIIINDGSLDNTEAVIMPLLKQDSRIRYFIQDHKGVSSARNKGLQQMKGLFVLFLDADDCLTNDSIGSRILKFELDETLSFCDGGVIVCDESLSIVRRHWKPSATGNVFKDLLRLNGSCFFGPTWLIKMDKIHYFADDMTHAEDLYFFITIAKNGNYGFVEQDVLKYRTSANSAMRNLPGLALGYKMLYSKISDNFKKEVACFQRFQLWLKIKKIMTLSFLREGHFANAVRFLIMGTVK